MLFSRVLFGIVCLGPLVLAAQHGETGTLPAHEDRCKVPSEEDVLLLQRQVHLDGRLALRPSLMDKWTKDNEAPIQWSTFDISALCEDFEVGGEPDPPSMQDPGVVSGRAVDGNLETTERVSSKSVYHHEGKVNALYLIFTEPRYVGSLELTWGLLYCKLYPCIQISLIVVDNGGKWTWDRKVTLRGVGNIGWHNDNPNVTVSINATIIGIEIHALDSYCKNDDDYIMCFDHGGWLLREVRVSVTTTTTTTTLTIPNNQCPLATQVSNGNWLPLETPLRKECFYNGASSVGTISDMVCGDVCQVSAHLAHALETGPDVDRLPAKIAADIIHQIQEVSEKYFHNAGLEKDDAFSTSAKCFELMEDSLASMVGGYTLETLMKDHYMLTFNALRHRITTWAGVSSSSRLVLRKEVDRFTKAVSKGAFDTVAAMSGPFGVSASILSSVLPVPGMESNKASCERIAAAVKEKVKKYVASKPYDEEIVGTQSLLMAFTEVLGYALPAFQALALSPTTTGSMQQYILLSSLEGKLTATRSSWLYAEPCTDCSETSPCADVSKAKVHIIPLLIMMHMAVLHQMSLAVIFDNFMAYEVQKKLYQYAFEYYQYIRRVSVNAENFWTGTCDPLSGYPENYGTIIHVCCAVNGSQQDAELRSAMSASGEEGLGYRLLQLARLGQSGGFINEPELDENSGSALLQSALLLQAGASSSMGQKGELPQDLSAINDDGGASMSRPRNSMSSKGSTTMRLAKAGHAFDESPNVQPPRNHWEAEYHRICGRGLACLREEISKEKAQELNLLALEVSNSLKEQGMKK